MLNVEVVDILLMC